MSKQIAVVVGVGAREGLGASLCRRAGKDGYHVVVVGRTLEKIEQIVSDILERGGSASAHVVDVTNKSDISSLFSALDNKDGELDFFVYNAGNAFVDDCMTMTADFFEEAWRTCCLGGFLMGQEAAQRLVKRRQGTILFTGATASIRSRNPYLAFASGKAALRAVAAAFAREIGPKGVHVSHIIIDGSIDGEIINTRVPGLKERLGEGGMLNPDAIAESYWQLHRQHPSAWTFELDLRPSIEKF